MNGGAVADSGLEDRGVGTRASVGRASGRPDIDTEDVLDQGLWKSGELRATGVFAQDSVSHRLSGRLGASRQSPDPGWPALFAPLAPLGGY